MNTILVALVMAIDNYNKECNRPDNGVFLAVLDLRTEPQKLRDRADELEKCEKLEGKMNDTLAIARTEINKPVPGSFMFNNPDKYVHKNARCLNIANTSYTLPEDCR